MPFRHRAGNHDCAIISDTMSATLGGFQLVNGHGARVFAEVMAEPRGGLTTLVAMLFDQVSGAHPIKRRHDRRYGTITDRRILFQGTLIRSQDTETASAASDETTIGGKAGVVHGIRNAEISVSVTTDCRSHGKPVNGCPTLLIGHDLDADQVGLITFPFGFAAFEHRP